MYSIRMICASVEGACDGKVQEAKKSRNEGKSWFCWNGNENEWKNLGPAEQTCCASSGEVGVGSGR